ncbi:dihydroxy-acid dehydratase [Neobacillus thermocopriae]|jgi:dihydroxy-acid dehydratase|uniref:dihydroxy-acid dehydratase n=1 Tax=Neobacillus thermocopriae TaxID=1215031 RepID=UPI002E1BBA62|nr:dihydroxy-acid dehydratase [Neobacillus thermocopriae]MED3625527.1 dihydroxy-acid dehydratase [Neobacillus thermocopriae]MED3713410.1 dihydroxy-acid dehydratase [Neobacillus thermocopriae]
MKKSHTSYGDAGFSQFLRMAFQRHLGHDEADFEKPIIGICNTYSEVNRCHSHIKPLVEAIKQGVIAAGGTPLEFPMISLGEMFISPTTMMYRNLAAMDTEEMISAQPIDGVVLIGGCDKMLPAQLMGAASANKPAIAFTGGPMGNGQYKGQTLGACSDCRHFWQEYKAGTVCEEELKNINAQLAPTAGHCMVMGSASTIAACAEAIGMMLPGACAAPATVNERMRLARETGKAIVHLVEKDIRPSNIMSKRAFENGIRTLMAVGGSTNAVIHLIAIARRLGIHLTLEDFERLSRTTPFIANLRPAGQYQMEDLYHAGGIPAVLKELSPLLNLNELTVTGKILGENLSNVQVDEVYRNIIRPFHEPLHKDGGITILRGNLAPNGAIIKPKAAINKALLKHRGKAVVFTSISDMERRVNDPNLEVDQDSVLVLQNAGPVGAPGMPEAGMIPIPNKLLKQGVRDMVRLSDCRMSGTAFGTVVLHVAPEAAVGGAIGLVKDGDWIELDVENRSLELLVSEEELERRRKEWKPPHFSDHKRGYGWLYRRHVLQADEGCDFDFLVPEPRSMQPDIHSIHELEEEKV